MTVRYPETVHWHEGLFLRPQHFQSLQASLDAQRRADRCLLKPYPYGLAEISIDEAALANSIVKLDRLVAITPTGVEVSMPGNAEIAPLNIRKSLDGRHAPLTLLLAVPLKARGQPNLCQRGDPPAGQRKLHKAKSRLTPDEDTGDNEQPVSFLQPNAFLALEGDNLSDMEALPLARLLPEVEAGAGRSVRVDPHYFPPCLLASAWRDLSRLAADLCENLAEFREELLVGLRRSRYTAEVLSGAQAERVMQLQAVNMSLARLEPLMACGACAPFDLYVELRALLGGLAALQPSRDLHNVPPYVHDDCRPAFTEIVTRIKSLIGRDTGTYIKIPFEFDAAKNFYTASISEEHLIRGEDYFLALECRENAAAVVRLVESGDQFKLTTAGAAFDRVRGIRLREERYLPPVLPPLQNVIWFSLRRNESPRIWSGIRDERKAAIACSPQTFPALKACLYITVYGNDAGGSR